MARELRENVEDDGEEIEDMAFCCVGRVGSTGSQVGACLCVKVQTEKILRMDYDMDRPQIPRAYDQSIVLF